MRFIRTQNNYVEFIEADNNGEVLSTRGFQFGELYFRIENNKVTFYLNDQENPWRNDVWTINIPFELDGEIYDNENDASIALHNIMNDRFQEQLDELRADLEEEIGRSIATDEALGEEIDDERDRAINAEIYLQNQVTELSGTVTTFDGRITRVEEIVSGVQEDLHDEIVRSTNKDTEHDVLISGLTEDVEYLEIHKQNVLTAGKYITIQNDIISADSNHVYRITQNAYDNLPEIDPEGLYIITDAPDISLCDYTPLSAFTAEVNRSTTKDLEHDLLISGLTDGLDVEIQNRIAADNLLQQNLNNEIARATSAETILHDEIINERDRALESESAITLALHNEVVRSTEKDALHDTLISGLTDGLQNEIERATTAENSLRNDLNIEISARTSADSAITLALSNEITRSTEKDAELSALISGLTDSYSAETLSRIAADNLLQQNIDNEIARATSAETILHNEIISERDRAICAETILDNKIDAEIARSTAKDIEHDTLISGISYDISAETQNRIAADNVLQQNINNEVTSRISGDTILHNEILAEETRATNRETELHTEIVSERDRAISAETEIRELIISGGTFDPSMYYDTAHTYSKTEVNNLLDNKQNKLTAGTGIQISGDVISVTGGSQPVDAYTKAESDAKFATITNFNSHSGNTTVHITAAERTEWNTKPDVWCGDETAWGQISGSTTNGTIYLVY